MPMLLLQQQPPCQSLFCDDADNGGSPGVLVSYVMQHPKVETKQSVLMRASFIRDSFTEDTLLSVCG